MLRLLACTSHGSAANCGVVARGLQWPAAACGAMNWRARGGCARTSSFPGRVSRSSLRAFPLQDWLERRRPLFLRLRCPAFPFCLPSSPFPPSPFNIPPRRSTHRHPNQTLCAFRRGHRRQVVPGRLSVAARRSEEPTNRPTKKGSDYLHVTVSTNTNHDSNAPTLPSRLRRALASSPGFFFRRVAITVVCPACSCLPTNEKSMPAKHPSPRASRAPPTACQ